MAVGTQLSFTPGSLRPVRLLNGWVNLSSDRCQRYEHGEDLYFELITILSVAQSKVKSCLDSHAGLMSFYRMRLNLQSPTYQRRRHTFCPVFCAKAEVMQSFKMRHVRTTTLINHGRAKDSTGWKGPKGVVLEAVAKVRWPPGGKNFTIHPQSGKLRGEGNGVKPIKLDFMRHLKTQGWQHEFRLCSPKMSKFGGFDAALCRQKYLPVVVEWETGNISSSHRSLNKMALAIISEQILGGILIIPSRNLCKYLTDRIGNYEELQPYFPIWRSIQSKLGVLQIFVVEHDSTNMHVPRIPKSTDGRSSPG